MLTVIIISTFLLQQVQVPKSDHPIITEENNFDYQMCNVQLQALKPNYIGLSKDYVELQKAYLDLMKKFDELSKKTPAATSIPIIPSSTAP